MYACVCVRILCKQVSMQVWKCLSTLVHMCITLLIVEKLKKKEAQSHTHAVAHLCTANNYNEAIKHRNSLVVDYGVFDDFECQ